MKLHQNLSKRKATKNKKSTVNLVKFNLCELSVKRKPGAHAVIPQQEAGCISANLGLHNADLSRNHSCELRKLRVSQALSMSR